jgi:DNA replication protein DnaC
LIESGWRVLLPRTSDIVQRLQMARQSLALEAAIAKLDKYHLLILDDWPMLVASPCPMAL